MNDGVEFVTSAPEELETEAPAAAGRTPWRREELEMVLTDASSHVRFLLKELAEGGEVPTSRLKSRPVAYAQVQRICSSRGNEPLVVPSLNGGVKSYSLHPAYREQVARLVAEAVVPPPSIPKDPSERKPRRARRSPQDSALTGIADVRGSSLSIPAAPPRRLAQGTLGKSLSIPQEIEIEFCKELLGFMNGTANGTRYRIILEDDGYKLEAV
jgi:hypothetical protein